MIRKKHGRILYTPILMQNTHFLRRFVNSNLYKIGASDIQIDILMDQKAHPSRA